MEHALGSLSKPSNLRSSMEPPLPHHNPLNFWLYGLGFRVKRAGKSAIAGIPNCEADRVSIVHEGKPATCWQHQGLAELAQHTASEACSAG